MVFFDNLYTKLVITLKGKEPSGNYLKYELCV